MTKFTLRWSKAAGDGTVEDLGVTQVAVLGGTPTAIPDLAPTHVTITAVESEPDTADTPEPPAQRSAPVEAPAIPAVAIPEPQAS